MNQFRSSPAHFRFLASEGRIPELLEMLEVGPSHADVLPAFEYDTFVHDVKSASQLPKYASTTLANVRKAIDACASWSARQVALSLSMTKRLGTLKRPSWDAVLRAREEHFRCRFGLDTGGSEGQL